MLGDWWDALRYKNSQQIVPSMVLFMTGVFNDYKVSIVLFYCIWDSCVE